MLLDSGSLHPRQDPCFKKIMKTPPNSHITRGADQICPHKILYDYQITRGILKWPRCECDTRWYKFIEKSPTLPHTNWKILILELLEGYQFVQNLLLVVLKGSFCSVFIFSTQPQFKLCSYMFIIDIWDAIKKTRRLRTLSENTMTHGYQIWGFKAELVMRIHLLIGSWMLKIWGVMEVPEWFVLVLELIYDLCDLYCIIVYILWTSASTSTSTPT